MNKIKAVGFQFCVVPLKNINTKGRFEDLVYIDADDFVAQPFEGSPHRFSPAEKFQNSHFYLIKGSEVIGAAARENPILKIALFV